MNNTYFIHHIQTYANVNRKGKEMIEFVSGLKCFLVPDDCSLDALKADIEEKVNELNSKYPKTKPIRFRQHENQFRVDVDEYNIVFILSYSKVRGYYVFGEDRMEVDSLSANTDVCKICGCTENDPCYHPDHGNCWWADEEHTVCSHCANPEMMNDPATVHCINSKGLIVE